MVFDFQLLEDAWKAEKKGKTNAPNQQRYRYELEENLFSLQERLQTGTFYPAPLRLKQIYYPKRREAQVPSQEDKIVQHAICDEHAYYPLVKPLVKEASANTRGRGTDYGVKMLREHLRAFWLREKRPPYILKADMKSFFASIPHDRAIALIDRYIEDTAVLEIIRRFIALTDGRGLPLGLQQSQLIANLYLSELDHKVKERWRFMEYGRHMDDFYVLCESRERLEEFLQWLTAYTASIGLTLNAKTDIFYRAFDYLGFHFIVSDSGKIITRLSKGKLVSKRRHLKKLVGQLSSGKITPERMESAYFGWRQHACKAKNGRTQVMNMDKYLDGLLNRAGYELSIYKVPNGIIKWRVLIAKGGT